MVSAAVRLLRPESAIEAAGYIRVSLERQADGHSPDVQREAIKRLAAQEGYVLTLVEEDHERGSKVTRKGYQRIIEAVRQGTIHVVIVHFFDRWGRDGAEWLTRAREFERLGVPIISVQEGRDEGGMMRFIRAGMAEEYSRQLAKRVRPAHERAARQGTHMGPTPLGFHRLYPAWDGSGRRPIGRLVPDEATAGLVREMFTRYADGNCSVRILTRWLNSDPRTRALAPGRGWYATTVQRTLRNPVYKGSIRYNRQPTGRYERAAPGSEFTVEDTHEALVDPSIWATVQYRLEAAARKQTYNHTLTKAGHPIALGSGLFRCETCHTAMYAHRYAVKKTVYICLRRHGGDTCPNRGYTAAAAHPALLAAVKRLRGSPWTPQAEARLTGTDGVSVAKRVATLQRALEQEQERMRRNARHMSDIDAPTPEELAAFRQVGAEIAARMRSLDTEIGATAQKVQHLPALQTIHAKLTRTEMVTVIEALEHKGDAAGLRELIMELVESAVVTERVPAGRPAWVRVAVTWTRDVQTLLEAGLLRLDEEAPTPHIATGKERARERRRARYLATGR